MKYTTVESRLSTYVNWPNRGPPHILDLARAGFYYIGPGDKVRCAYCNGDLNNWSATDDPLEEHKRLLPLCPFLDERYTSLKRTNESKSVGVQTTKPNGESCINQASKSSIQLPNNSQIHLASPQQVSGNPVSSTHQGLYYSNGTWRPVNTYLNSTTISPSQPTRLQTHQQLDYTKEKDRLKSFMGWTGQVDPRQLAHAGLYFLGNSDRVQCFSCQTIFRDWVAGDDPWIEHAKWYPDCPYIQLCLGKDTVQEIRRNVLNSAPSDVLDCVH